jgi:hypothetical protein
MTSHVGVRSYEYLITIKFNINKVGILKKVFVFVYFKPNYQATLKMSDLRNFFKFLIFSS